MTSPDEFSVPALADVRSGARWPWVALAAGAAIVAAGGFAFSPSEQVPPGGGQPTTLAVPAAP